MRSVYLLFTLIAIATCSTLLSVSPDFTISYQTSYNELAHAYYDQKINSQGMNYFYSYANGLKSLADQHRGAGFLEGYATYLEIHAAYLNFNKFKVNDASVKPKLQEYLNNQMEFIETMADKFSRDVYWQQAYAFLEQARYAYRGFLQRIHEEGRLDLYIGFSQYYYLTSIGDFRELLPTYNNPSDTPEKSCTGFIKKVDNEIFVAHSTGSYYPYMLRIVKSYHFPTRDESVGAQTITFSSRPGDFNSKDSFYILSSGLKVVETSFMNFNKDNYNEMTFKSVPSWIRANVANILAKNGRQWVDYYSKYNSATHSGQWIVVDSSKITDDSGLVIFLEQGFSMIKVKDMTERLHTQGFIGTYNVPYNQQIYNKLQYQQHQFDYENDPSAVILKKLNPNMNNLQDIKKWMYYNNQTTPGAGIAPRAELDEKPLAYGLIDCKVTSLKTDEDNYFWMRSSPTTSEGRFPTFKWSTLPELNHEGMPNQYNFDWVKVPINVQKYVPTKHLQTE